VREIGSFREGRIKLSDFAQSYGDFPSVFTSVIFIFCLKVFCLLESGILIHLGFQKNFQCTL
jgi:hypothetical protein